MCIRIGVMIGLLLLLPIQLSADEGGAAAKLAERIEQLKSKGGAGNLPPVEVPSLTQHVDLNSENEALQQRAIGAYFKHVTESNAHQLKVFRWQLFSAKLIFGVVLVLVAAGIYFAAVQFHHGLRSGKEEAATELEASAAGIKISSPVLGVIILTLSLAFFYLYLVHVYPIEFVGGR